MGQEKLNGKTHKKINKLQQSGDYRGAIELTNPFLDDAVHGQEAAVLNMESYMGLRLLDSARYFQSLVTMPEAIKNRFYLDTLTARLNRADEQYKKLTNDFRYLDDSASVNQAEQIYFGSIEIDSGNYLAYYRMARFYQMKGMDIKAEMAYGKAIKKFYPNSESRSEVYQSYGRFLDDMMKYQKSAEVLLQGFNQDSSRLELIALAGIMEYKAQKNDLAIQYLTYYVSAFSRNYEAWNYLGKAYRKNNDHSKAAKAFNKALSMNARNPEIFYSLGMSYYDLTFYDSALVSFQVYLQRFEKDPGVLNALGCTQCQMSLYKEAVNSFKQGIDIEPRTELRYNLGWSLIRSGKPEEAERYFLSLLTENDRAPLYRLGYLTALGEQGKYEEAEKYATECIEKFYFIRNYYVLRSEFRKNLDDNEGSARDLEAAENPNLEDLILEPIIE
jgi:tetratricopeptide (TPR) repeat protein